MTAEAVAPTSTFTVDGDEIISATITGIDTAAEPLLSFTVTIADPSALPTTISDVPLIDAITFAESEEVAVYGTFPPEIAIVPYPLTSTEMELGVATRLDVTGVSFFVSVLVSLSQPDIKRMENISRTPKILDNEFKIVMAFPS